MKGLSSKNGSVLVALLAAAGAVAYVVWGFMPQRAALAELSREVEAKQTAVARGANLAKDIAAAGEELLVAEAYATRWSSAAPSQDSLITLFRDINQLSQNAGARNLRLEPAPVENLAAVWRAPVALSIEGTFPQLFEFVRGVELLCEGLEVTSIEIEQAGDPAEALRMKATLRIFGAGRDFPVTQGLPISR